MENSDAQATIAYLLGRATAAESVIKTLIASRHQDVLKLSELLRINLDHRARFLEQDFETSGLPASLLPMAQEAFSAAKKAAAKGLSSGRYVPPDVRQPRE